MLLKGRIKTLSEFDDNKNNNFNLLRLFAALLVIYTHSYGLSGRYPDAELNPIAYFIGQLGNVGVDIFFVISGFLVTRSYLHRKHLLKFVLARVLRIFPALIVAVLCCVFIFGVLNTQLAYRAFIQHPDVWRFIGWNISLLKTQVTLPGVFVNNAYPNDMNGSLWTLPLEARLYCYVAFFGVIGVLHTRVLFNVTALLLLVIYIYRPDYIPLVSDKALYFKPAWMFLLGSFCYINKKYVPMNSCLILLLASALLFVVYRQPGNIVFVYSLFLPLAVLWFAYHLPSLHVFNRCGDYSYGLYIYAFPIQQTVIEHLNAVSVNLFFVISVLLTLIPAFISWRYLEKPILGLKMQ